MSTIDVQDYYAGLLIIQYNGRPKASATIRETSLPILQPDSNVQTLKFSPVPASGAFKLKYNGVSTASIAWNATAVTIQTDLNAILVSPLSVAVAGSIAAGLTFTFSNFTSVVEIISVANNTLLDLLSVASIPLVSPIGDQLLLEIQDAFNVTGSDTAIGDQLDIIGKYVGVTRTAFGFSSQVTLDDDDFLTLIQVAIIRNRSGSSLATIQRLLNQFFPGEILLTDYANMYMSYLIDTSIGSQDLVQLFVTEGILPKPMGVGISILAAPVIDEFFGFVTYDADVNPFGTPFNTYDSYSNVWIWANYADSVTP